MQWGARAPKRAYIRTCPTDVCLLPINGLLFSGPGAGNQFLPSREDHAFPISKLKHCICSHHLCCTKSILIWIRNAFLALFMEFNLIFVSSELPGWIIPCTPGWAAGILVPPGRRVFLFGLAILLPVYIPVRED